MVLQPFDRGPERGPLFRVGVTNRRRYSSSSSRHGYCEVSAGLLTFQVRDNRRAGEVHAAFGFEHLTLDELLARQAEVPRHEALPWKA
jgi:hypothetical protein